MTIQLSDIDIRQLKIFRAVVESEGFTNAEVVLNVSQSTISHQMSNLEARLGINLCERGRAGFKLTEKGEMVYAETLKLFKAHESFQYATRELKGELSGHLNIVLIENVVTDPECPIVSALKKFNYRDHNVTISLETAMSGEIERSLLSADTDIALGSFERKLPGLKYKMIYTENNILVCGSSHPIAQLNDPEEIKQAIRNSRKVTRGYNKDKHIENLEHDPNVAIAVAQSLEAQAILILGGSYIGFLPNHYAQSWVEQKRLKVIAPDEIFYRLPFYVVTRRSPRKSKIIDTFMADLKSAIAESSGRKIF